MESKRPASSQREALEMLIKEYYEKMMKYRPDTSEKSDMQSNPVSAEPIEDMPVSQPVSDDGAWVLPKQSQSSEDFSEDTSEVFAHSDESNSNTKANSSAETVSIDQFDDSGITAEVSSSLSNDEDLPDIFSEWKSVGETGVQNPFADLDFEEDEPVSSENSVSVSAPSHYRMDHEEESDESDDPPVSCKLSSFAPFTAQEAVNLMATAQSVHIPRIYFSDRFSFPGTFQPYHSFSDSTNAPMFQDPTHCSQVLVSWASFYGTSSFSPVGMSITWPKENGYTITAINKNRALSSNAHTASQLLRITSGNESRPSESFWELCSHDVQTTPYLLESLCSPAKGLLQTQYATPYTSVWSTAQKQVPVRYTIRPESPDEFPAVYHIADLPQVSGAGTVRFVVSAQIADSDSMEQDSVFDSTAAWPKDEIPLTDLGVLIVELPAGQRGSIPISAQSAVRGVEPCPDPFTAALFLAGEISDHRSDPGSACNSFSVPSALHHPFTPDDTSLKQGKALIKSLSREQMESLCQSLAQNMRHLKLSTIDRLLKNFSCVHPMLRSCVEASLRKEK